jgi:transcriptional regulator with XRE-family HTH domain
MIDSERLYVLIGERVRRIREAQTPRMSQGELARILDLKRTSITNIELGNQKLPVDTLYRLCERFGLAVQEIMPPVSDVTHAEGRSIVVGGKSHDVGVKTASLVARLRPGIRSRRNAAKTR